MLRGSTRSRWGALLGATAAAAAIVIGPLAVATPARADTTAPAPDAVFAANVGSGFSAATNLTMQSDGKIVVGGSFTTFNGATANRLVRLNADGTPDNAFNAALGTGFNSNVTRTAVQADGKIVVGGNFTSLNGAVANRLARLNPDGTLDAAFSAAVGTGPSVAPQRVAIQADGKILVSGFPTFNGATVNQLVRLNPDGSRDTAFSTVLGSGFNGTLSALLLQPDGAIVAGGNFTSVSGTATSRLVRLTAAGAVDTAFSANLGAGFNLTVSALGLQPDGKLLTGGTFSSLNGASASQVARVNADGTPDTAFNSNVGTGAGGSQTSGFAVRSDGKIVVTGTFLNFNGVAIAGLARLNADGTPDLAYNASLGSGLRFGATDIRLLTDDTFIVGGAFTSYNGATVNRIVKLTPTTVAIALPDQTSTVGELVSVQPVASTTGGPIVYSATGLPAGLAIDPSTGTISGTPTTLGSTTVAVTATSSTVSDTTTLTWTIEPAAVAPAITSAAPADAFVGSPYSFTVTASGTPAPSFAVSAGALPPGVTLDAATGLLSGTPTVDGAYEFTITASNTAGSADGSYVMLVQSPPLIASGDPQDGVTGIAYSYTLQATGVPAPTFAVSDGALPPGLTLDPATGAISGTPTTVGQYDFTVTATNAVGSDSRPYAMTIGAVPVITSPAPGAGVVGMPYRMTVTASGSPAPTFAVTAGELPPGLTLDTLTGVITGSPTSAGSYSFTITASNASGADAADYTITVTGGASGGAGGGAAGGGVIGGGAAGGGPDNGGPSSTPLLSSPAVLASTGADLVAPAVMGLGLLFGGLTLRSLRRRQAARP